MNIGILGMGGVGSFIGAKLADHYRNDKETNIIFICRNETKEAINRDGLCLLSGDKTIIARPYMASDDPKKIGLLDILFVATKSFSLDQAINQYQECITENTIIIPLLNGVDTKQILEKNIDLDGSRILEGCIYVASNIKKPGVVQHVGGPGKIYFGSSDELNYVGIEDILIRGGLDVVYTNEIKKILWKKYLFVSPLATMTTALNITFGEVAQEVVHMEKLEAMMLEVQALSQKFDVLLTTKDIQDSLDMISKFPFESKSSLQLDFENKNSKTEKESFVDFVINNGKMLGIPVGHYEEMNQKIIGRSKNR